MEGSGYKICWQLFGGLEFKVGVCLGFKVSAEGRSERDAGIDVENTAKITGMKTVDLLCPHYLVAWGETIQDIA